VTESNSSTSEPQNRNANALVIFLLFVLPMPFCLFVYHVVLWFAEQIALSWLSGKAIAWAGPIGLALQGIVIAGLSALLWRYTNDDRFKPVYAVLIGAGLIAFPALLLRALGPNNDQVGSILQFAIAIVAAFAVVRVRKQIEWDRGALPFGLLIAGIGIAPLAIHGSFGSLGDIFLSLLAGLSFGLLAATLMPPTTGHILLDGVSAGAVLALLASALGYDGSQLLLLLLVPAFSFAIAAMLPSRAAAAAASGLLAFAALALFDPTELTILLGDILGLAQKAIGSALLIGWGASIIALILRSTAAKSAGSRTKRAVGWAGAGVAWMFLIALFLLFGNPGNYSDRLFVIMKDQADISGVAEIEDREQRLSAAYEGLTEHARTTQAGLRELFDKAGIEYTPYYLENAIEVRGGTLVRLFLLTRPEVERVIPSPRLRAAPADDPSPGPESAPGPSYTGWNIKIIGADKVWNEFNVRGQGIVVGQSDSGVDGDHPALREQYRGFNQGDDYNWYDPWDSTTSPNDEGGHGTHTMGTILGADGIGVAPEAKWIGCVNLDRNLGNPALYLDCMQFMLAPFPYGGDPFDDGDPGRAVHVMNNSWGCPSIEGCDANALKDAADNLRHAGIFVVVSTGNDGPGCETVASPLSLYDSVFSVGAIDQFGDMAEFSSRGPVTADGSGRMKPDITAPGVDILSAMPQGTYGSNSGTSMAGPHVVGVVALIWSARPDLIGDIDTTEQLIINTAQPYNGDRSVGCFNGDQSNAAYGYGIVDVYEAVRQALEE
jgi:subtilisin family serine protease